MLPSIALVGLNSNLRFQVKSAVSALNRMTPQCMAQVNSSDNNNWKKKKTHAQSDVGYLEARYLIVDFEPTQTKKCQTDLRGWLTRFFYGSVENYRGENCC